LVGEGAPCADFSDGRAAAIYELARAGQTQQGPKSQLNQRSRRTGRILRKMRAHFAGVLLRSCAQLRGVFAKKSAAALKPKQRLSASFA
jgi:hypothetical protein